MRSGRLQIRVSIMPQDKTGMLKAFLGGLPGPAAARLAMAVEVDRLMDGRTLPHDDIMEGLRPVLRRENYDRTPTPLRLFCRPFQDLLTSMPRKAKQKGCIARSSLVPAWHWVTQTLLPAEAAAYSAECKALVLAHKPDDALARAARFWRIAAEAMYKALATEAGRRSAQALLGDALAVEDVLDMALLLSAGEIIEQLIVLLPMPVHAFNEQLVWQVREIYDRLVAEKPDVAPYVPIIVMNRLNRPWEALRLPLLVTRHTDETLISKTDMGLVGEILFARMDALKTSIQATRHPIFDADRLLDEAKSFADLSSHIVKEIELKREGEWGKRLLAERVQIGKVMESFMDRAPKEFAAALPTSKGKGADFSRHPGAEKHDMALRYARLVAGSRPFAAAASFAAKQMAAYDEIATLLKRYNEDVVKALKTDPQNSVVNAQFLLCAELTATMFSDQEAELLRRRGRAALSAAA
ncbi:MAG TPA: hypothetical protein VH189_04370 [Rhizomicrobium sp.]|nr:hypothetical protein [Rhizomicrobium sp.]